MERPELRAHQRFPMEAPIALQFESGEAAQSGFTANISLGGVFVKVRDPRPVGSLVRLELDLGGASPIRTVAEVAWIRVRSEGSGEPTGMGLQFRYLDPDSRSLLKRKLTEHLPQEPEPAEREPARAPEAVAAEPDDAAEPDQPAAGRLPAWKVFYYAAAAAVVLLALWLVLRLVW